MPHALVVDDDVDSANSMGALIAGEHFTVALAHTLRDARRQISLQQPDILLLDLRLPDGNGMELLAASWRQLRQTHRERTNNRAAPQPLHTWEGEGGRPSPDAAPADDGRSAH